jgi:hypothetical protein
MVGLVFVVITESPRVTAHPVPGLDVAVVVCLLGMASLLGERLIERPLDCSTIARLGSTYRSRFFLRIAFANAIALIGFVGFMVTNEGWILLLAALFALIGYLRLVPTSANLAKEQDLIIRSGCHLVLIDALGRTPPIRPRT